MKTPHGEPDKCKRRQGAEPALQIICLASGGGPSEDNVTGFLVRSLEKKWSKGSVLAVDAGTHLAGITRLLLPSFPSVAATSQQAEVIRPIAAFPEDLASTYASTRAGSEVSDDSSASAPEPMVTILTTGPFAGLPFPFSSAGANALHVVRECISTYLITHPHLDHLSAFAINTAAFHNTSRPKRLAALPSTVNAIKTHIFNDVIWPNLTDEDGGVGFVTFQRLTQGGNIAVGEGHGIGYIEVCDGLCVKGMKISHGHCLPEKASTSHRQSDTGLSEATLAQGTPNIKDTIPSLTRRTPSITQLPGTPVQINAATQGNGLNDHAPRELVVDSTAYFIRDDATGREVLFFGDVEPDTLSLNPRTKQVWMDAAPKVAAGILKAVLIECSYDDSQGDAVLFGHLAPRHLIAELLALAELVNEVKAEGRAKREAKKRKWLGSVDTGKTALQSDSEASTTSPRGPAPSPKTSKRSKKAAASLEMPASSVQNEPPGEAAVEGDGHDDTHVKARQPSKAPLTDFTAIVIHMKDPLKDGPPIGDTIFKQLQAHDARLRAADGLGLGCEFVISEVGATYSF